MTSRIRTTCCGDFRSITASRRAAQRRRDRGRGPAATLHRRNARGVRRRALASRRRSHEPTVAVAALRSHLGASRFSKPSMTHERWTSRSMGTPLVENARAGGASRREQTHFSISSSPGARLASICAPRVPPTTGPSSRPALGAGHPRDPRVDPRSRSTVETSSKRPARTTPSGTPRNASSCVTAGCTTTCACCGERRSWNGPPHRAKRST